MNVINEGKHSNASPITVFLPLFWGQLLKKKLQFSLNFSDDNDDDELFLWYGWQTKGVSPYFQPEPFAETLTITNLRHAASRIWNCAEPEFVQCWRKLCSSDHHYTTAPKRLFSIGRFCSNIITCLVLFTVAANKDF